MSILKEIYNKDIEREIQGVIKVDSENYIRQELEEYVVTDELLKHFHNFFSAYKNSITKNTENMGVWISGDFGSGKSHFLKIISFLLENKIVNGKQAVDYFNDKINDPLLLADIKLAGQLSSDVILFDIDSKSESNNGKKHELLDVFEKVFNEKMGLSITPFVAEIERHIIEQGKYEDFKKVFATNSKRSWESERDAIQFVEDEFAQSYSQVLNKTVEEARKIIDRTEKNYTLSIEKFAERIRKYIESKGNNHHVIFLVDEIGQYIGEDDNLMLNLQTIVEDLGIQCGGKAWVIVTSQEAIDKFIKVKGTNFSKIQGRFDTKLSLSSTDIDEVIKKRILEKTKDSKEELEIIYQQKESVIKNLLTFKGATHQDLYEDSDDFTQTYPFVPYQFKLLQSVFTDIRKFGYAGKHLSSGERSLLGAFQQTAKIFGDKEIKTLIPFYAFYDTIEQFLEHQVRRVIRTAEDTKKAGELKDIDIEVLKMLFMLKNIREIPANIDNLSTLYVSNIADDKLVIRNEVKESLIRLERQTLIQRINDEYKFLTDEEQEINKEIKSIVIDQNKVTDYLKKIVFDYILTDNKFAYKNKNFSLTKYIDDTKYSQSYEIGIKVITSMDDSEIFRTSAIETNLVFAKLEISTLIYDEIINYLQVEDYRRSKSGISQTQQIEDIIRAKQRAVEKAEERIKENIREQLNQADIIISGDTQKIISNEAKERINKALEILVNNIYTKFSYVKKNSSMQDINVLFHANKQELLGLQVKFENEKAYEEIKAYCNTINGQRIPLTIRGLLQHFTVAPYGFTDEDVLYLLTKLLKDEYVSLIYNNEIQSLTSEDTLAKILKKDYYDKTKIKIKQKIAQNLISDVESVARDSFNIVNLRDDEDGRIEDFKEKCLLTKIDFLRKLQAYYNPNEKYSYPGKDNIDDALIVFNTLYKIKDNENLYQLISEKKDEIKNLCSKIDIISDFFSGAQKKQFDEAKAILINYNNNKDFTDKNTELIEIANSISTILTSKEPYGKIREIPALKTKLKKLLSETYNKESEPIINDIKNTITYIANEIKNAKVNKAFGDTYIQKCKETITKLENSNELKDIYAQRAHIAQLKERFCDELDEEKNKEKGQKSEPTVHRKKIKIDTLMNRSYEINSKEDIENYLKDLKEKLLEELKENKNIVIR